MNNTAREANAAMGRDARMLRVLAAIGLCTTYAELAQDTSLPMVMLMNTVGYLRRRGHVDRINEGAPSNQIARFRRTQSGDARVEQATSDWAYAAPESEPDPEAPVDFETLTTVQHALRTQPPLATVWRPARNAARGQFLGR
ncbi:hypothetical protein NU688_18800 [Variovorax sp. ZS18.2.2]|uniref:hypothetical protein n=1 Tax=Variovorax sp. ZS18.2.2 TaxID=2971255 RepID=UPI0021516786|nr:hypothetical protein [Variovorax sp. ZS18.2.2]MCR6478218.1 hypothetical protein [Variovorax sp. ZS18.2.2]